MSLSAETLSRLEEAKASIEEWRTTKVVQIEAEATFLKTLDTSLSALTADPAEEVTSAAEDIINGLLSS